MIGGIKQLFVGDGRGEGLGDGLGDLLGVGFVEGVGWVDGVVLRVAVGVCVGCIAPLGLWMSPERSAMARVTASSKACSPFSPKYSCASSPQVAPSSRSASSVPKYVAALPLRARCSSSKEKTVPIRMSPLPVFWK